MSSRSLLQRHGPVSAEERRLEMKLVELGELLFPSGLHAAASRKPDDAPATVIEDDSGRKVLLGAVKHAESPKRALGFGAELVLNLCCLDEAMADEGVKKRAGGSSMLSEGGGGEGGSDWEVREGWPREMLIRDGMEFQGGEVVPSAEALDAAARVRWLGYPCRDFESEKTMFSVSLHCIHEVERFSGITLLHCAAGVSRSATVAILYLMYKQKMPLGRAALHVRKARPRIQPNLGFVEQLAQVEDVLIHNGYIEDIESLESIEEEAESEEVVRESSGVGDRTVESGKSMEVCESGSGGGSGESGGDGEGGELMQPPRFPRILPPLSLLDRISLLDRAIHRVKKGLKGI